MDGDPEYEARRAKAVGRLRALAELRDEEVAHSMADDVLLDLIADDEVRELWVAIEKWFA